MSDGRSSRDGVPNSWSITTWLIVINVAVYFIDGALGHFLSNNFYFSTEYSLEFWRFVTFQFLHANQAHLIFNMIGLYFFGPIVERYLDRKRYLAFYLLCGISGAFLYYMLNLLGFIAGDINIPGLLSNDIDVPLIGASAGVFGVLMAGSYLVPSAKVLFMFILPMQLRTLAWIFVGTAVLTVITEGSNAGGEAAHLGGAAAGWYFIRRPHHLRGFFDFLGQADPTSKHFRFSSTTRRKKGPTQAQIDQVLKKVSEKGLHSLNDKERKLLKEATRRSNS